MPAMHRPARVALLALLAACGGRRAPPPDESAGDEVMYKRLVLSLELLPAERRRGEADAGSTVALWLVETDETGSTRRVDLGELPGPCTIMRNPRGMAMKPLFALECTGGGGLRARLVYQRDQLIVLRAPGLSGDELDFEEAQRIDLPIGVRVMTE
jgi:hypothetical protein